MIVHVASIDRSRKPAAIAGSSSTPFCPCSRRPAKIERIGPRPACACAAEAGCRTECSGCSRRDAAGARAAARTSGGCTPRRRERRDRASPRGRSSSRGRRAGSARPRVRVGDREHCEVEEIAGNDDTRAAARRRQPAHDGVEASTGSVHSTVVWLSQASGCANGHRTSDGCASGRRDTRASGRLNASRFATMFIIPPILSGTM